MDESEDNKSCESWIREDSNSAVKIKPKKRSLVERELETNLTARVTSPVTSEDGTSTSRYGRARRLKTDSELSDSRKIMLEVLKNTPPEKSPAKLQSPVYKMHASNSPIRTVSPKRAPVETFLENQIETIYQENISLSRFSTDEIMKTAEPCKNKKIYIQKDLIQSREPEETVVLIKNIFSPIKGGSDKSTSTHLNNILERSSEKFNLINKDNTQNGFIDNSSVVKTLDFDSKKKRKENKDTKCVSKSDLFELEAKCTYQVGDLAWSRMGTYPFWPCIVTRDPTTGIYVKKKLFGRIERDVIHVTFFGDNGRRGWIVDSMLRKFKGLAEFESTRDKFTTEDKKKDPRLYAAFFISDKKQALWHISVEEAEILLREPKRLRIELLNDILENSKSYKINNKTQKSGKVTRTDSDVSLSESLYDTLFSEDDGKTDDSERSKNKSRNKSLDVSEVVTACLDNMAAKTGITKIQRQSHMDRWLQKAKSKTPEKSHIKAQIPKTVVDNKIYNNKKRKPHREAKPYNLRKSNYESHNLLAYHNEHDYSKFVSDDDSSSVKTNISDGFIENKYEFVPLEESGAGIGVIAKIESLANNKNTFKTKDNDFIITNDKDAKEPVCENEDNKLTENQTQNIESKQSHKLPIVQDKEVDINYESDNDDQQIDECGILKENKNTSYDTNSIEIDSSINNNKSLENSSPQNVTKNSGVSNGNPMEIDNIDVCEVTNTSTVLNKNSLSVTQNNVSIVDAEETPADNGSHDVSTNNLNLYDEKHNVIPVSHVNFKKEEINDSVVANIRIEKESTTNKGDDNIVLDLKLLQKKNNCDEVNINTGDCFLFQTESAFIHSIKSKYEDNLEDINSINTLVEEFKFNKSSGTKLLSKMNFFNDGNINNNSESFDDVKIIKSRHLNDLCDASEAEEIDNHINSSQEIYENHTNLQGKTVNEASIVQETFLNVQDNKSNSINTDDKDNSSQMSQNFFVSKHKLVDSDNTHNNTIGYENTEIHLMEFFNRNILQETETRKFKTTDFNETLDVNLIDSYTEVTSKEGSLKNKVGGEKNEMHPEKSLTINILQETDTRKNKIVDSNETLDINLIVSDIKITSGEGSLQNKDEKNKTYPEESLDKDILQETETGKCLIVDAKETLDFNVTESDIEAISKEGSFKDTVDKEKNEVHVEDLFNTNILQENVERIVGSNESSVSVNLTESDIEISLKEDNLGDFKDKTCEENIKIDTEESLTNGIQEIEINNFEDKVDDIDIAFVNSKVGDILSSEQKSLLRSGYNQSQINERDNPEFLKYLELRQDAVMEEHPELNEDAIITYLHKTWLYEESRKSDIKKINLDQFSSVKGLDDVTNKKVRRRLKGSRTEVNRKKSTAEREDKNAVSESNTSESSHITKQSVGLLKKKLSLKRHNRATPLSIEDLSPVPETKKGNTNINTVETDMETNIEVNYNREIEISSKSKCNSIIHNIDKESEIAYNTEGNVQWHPQLSSLHSNSISSTGDNDCEITKNVKEYLHDEPASFDSEANDAAPLIYSKLHIKTGEEFLNENENPEVRKDESKRNESFNYLDSEISLSNSHEKLKHDLKIINTLHENSEINKEESENNSDSFNSTDSETGLMKFTQNNENDTKRINRLDVIIEDNTADSESNNGPVEVINFEEDLAISKRKSKQGRKAIKPLDVSLDANKEDADSNNGSGNISNVETSITKPKQKSKYHRSAVNSFDEPEFQTYLELRQDSLLEENPQLTQEDIKKYLYKTWLYEENSKSDLKKTHVIAQSGLVKGLEQETVPTKRIKKRNKVPKEITDYFDVSPKDKPKRKSIKPCYNEDYYDLEDEVECLEINGEDNCGSQMKMDITEIHQVNDKPLEDSQDVYQLAEQEVDRVEIYFSELIKPKPNIFKGLLREKVCEICEKTGNLVKCKICQGMFHVNCVQSECKVVEISTPMRGRKKKKKAGRRPKNQEESEGHNDDRQDLSEENNISIDEIEMESITVDAVTLETQLFEKMKELLENTEAINYDSYTSDNELDWDDTIAGKCEIVDVKLKRKSSEGYVDYSDFKCNNCLKYDTPVCFVCKSDISKKESKIRQRCQVTHCNKYYHSDCLDHWPQTQFNAGEPSKYNKKVNAYSESLTCPRHVCHTCVSDDPRGCKTRFSGDKLARCVRCPATYHTFTKCIPAGSQILTASHIICPRHYQHRPGKVPCHVNTGWCFICALGGSLICCEYCPTSFHAECLNIDLPEGGYMCEDCETGRLPLYGEMVWVKLGHYRWWPGLILHPSEIPDNIMAVKHGQGEFVVRFFGQYDYYWVNRGRVFPFQEGDSGRISSQKSKIDAAFTTAMEHARRACEVLKSATPNQEESMDIASSLLPPHYVKLKVNKPCGSLCGRKLDDPELSLTQCDCNPDEEDPCGPYSQCLNRMLLTECGPSCRAGDRCNNRAFEKRLYPKLVPYRTPHRGWGLKTLEDIKAGQFVIEYVGELIDEEEFKRRMHRKHEIRDENFYFLTLDKERMIDAGPKGNLARFMNHCCEPNCETQKWTVLGDVRVGLFALYNIPANSEVTFNYNLESAGIEKKRCLCGAKRCSGYIGAKPKQDESQLKKGKVKRTYKKRKIEESPSLTTVKTKTKRLGRPPKPKELSDIERDLLIIRNATNGLSSDESSRSFSSESERLPRPLKRKRVDFSTEDIGALPRPESPDTKRQKFNDEVGD